MLRQIFGKSKDSSCIIIQDQLLNATNEEVTTIINASTLDELNKINHNMTRLKEMYQDFNTMLIEQQEALNTIESNIINTNDNVVDATKHFAETIEIVPSYINPFKNVSNMIKRIMTFGSWMQ